MQSKLIILTVAILAVISCEKKSAVAPSKFEVFAKIAKDDNQPEYIRGSAMTFDEILSEKQGLPSSKLSDAHWEMVQLRNESTIACYLEFLKALEKRIPDTLPAVETYLAMKAKAGNSIIIEYNMAQTVIMMSNSIRNITLYNDSNTDAEVEGVLKRLKEKHGTSETGKEILGFLKIVHEQGLGDRANGIKPWALPRRPPVYSPPG